MLQVLQLARQEIRDAAKWYESQQSGLGLQFTAELEATLTAIEQRPDRFPVLETIRTPRNIRRVMLDRFPYIVIYEILTERTVVLAVAHGSRRPNYWIRRRTQTDD